MAAARIPTVTAEFLWEGEHQEGPLSIHEVALSLKGMAEKVFVRIKNSTSEKTCNLPFSITTPKGEHFLDHTKYIRLPLKSLQGLTLKVRAFETKIVVNSKCGAKEPKFADIEMTSRDYPVDPSLPIDGLVEGRHYKICFTSEALFFYASIVEDMISQNKG